MFWRKPKPAEKPKEAAAALIEESARPDDSETRLANALSEYETKFYEKTSKALDEDAERAKKIVEEARNFVRDSRLGYALCRPLLEHVKHWPAWVKNGSDPDKFESGPFRYVDGSSGAGKPETTTVTFSYNSTVYSLRHIDKGMAPWATDDMNTYGKVELIKDGQTVLGLNISKDLSKDSSYWKMGNVYALLPGPWMKELIEMAAYIDGTRTREMENWRNNDALERAKGIQLPK